MLVFRTKPGLGVHRRAKHPDDHHKVEVKRREDQTRNNRWSDEEVELKQQPKYQEGVCFMKQAVLAKFLGKNPDLGTIWYIRKTDRYKEVLRRTPQRTLRR